jgi:hypothetical protein
MTHSSVLATTALLAVHGPQLGQVRGQRDNTLPLSEQDCELQEVYCHLSGVEHGWNYTRMLLDITCEEVEYTDLEERA